MIKKTVLIVLTIIMISCKGPEKDKTFNLNDTMNYKSKISKTQYYLNYNLFMSYEIYINDVKITNNIESGPVSGLEYLNEYILSSGKQTIRLIDRTYRENPNIPDDSFQRMKMEIFTTDENEENQAMLKALEFPKTSVPKPYYYENTWEFEAEVPYTLEGWSNGEDLTKMDEKELMKLTVAKFEQLRQLLNTGKVDEFIEENAKGYEEFVISNYYQKKWAEYDENIREGFADQRGNLLPLEHYQMRISGNGKLVSLERIDKEFRGESALLAVDKEENTLYTNRVYLFMPKGSHTLKPIRLIVDYGIAKF
ncbi:hypothetical protein [Aequorivita capsosiphonis]|uniref:hypothetical protein n=1 Tax=Aequorivita capsosiphonis TaxID=487317 RepID=UPI00047DACC3|nr:hypothetical protein [Aequorivita capsosiphonis]